MGVGSRLLARGSIFGEICPILGAIPLTVTPADWNLLAAPTISIGHDVLAGPLDFIGPRATLARRAPAGVGPIIGPDDQAGGYETLTLLAEAEPVQGAARL